MNVTVREAAKLFTSNQIAALADGDFSFVEKIASDYVGKKDKVADIASVFEDTLKRLGREYRFEYYFKNAIANRHLLGKHSLNTATMLSEFRVGKSKADCVIINGKTTCYEIKTEYDTLNRLNEQLNDYTRLFDEVYVVCAAKNLTQVLNATADNIGVMELTASSYLSIKRPAKLRTEPLEVDLLIKSLRKEEYLDLVYRTTGLRPKVPNSLLVKTCKEILESVDNATIAMNFIAVLKEKRLNNSSLINVLPRSLVNAAISYQFTGKQVDALKRIFTKREDCQCICRTSEVSNLS